MLQVLKRADMPWINMMMIPTDIFTTHHFFKWPRCGNIMIALHFRRIASLDCTWCEDSVLYFWPLQTMKGTFETWNGVRFSRSPSSYMITTLEALLIGFRFLRACYTWGSFIRLFFVFSKTYFSTIFRVFFHYRFCYNVTSILNQATSNNLSL